MLTKQQVFHAGSTVYAINAMVSLTDEIVARIRWQRQKRMRARHYRSKKDACNPSKLGMTLKYILKT